MVIVIIRLMWSFNDRVSGVYMWGFSKHYVLKSGDFWDYKEIIEADIPKDWC